MVATTDGFEEFHGREYGPTLRAASVLFDSSDAARTATDAAFVAVLEQWNGDDGPTDPDAPIRHTFTRRLRTEERRLRGSGVEAGPGTATYATLGAHTALDDVEELPVRRRVQVVLAHRPVAPAPGAVLDPALDPGLAGEIELRTRDTVVPDDGLERVFRRAGRRTCARRTALVVGSALALVAVVVLVAIAVTRWRGDDATAARGDGPPTRPLETLPLVAPAGTTWHLVGIEPGEGYALTVDASGDGVEDTVLEVRHVAATAFDRNRTLAADVVLAGTTPVAVDRRSEVPRVVWYLGGDVRAELASLTPTGGSSPPAVGTDELVEVVRRLEPAEPAAWAQAVRARAPEVVPLTLEGAGSLRTIRWTGGDGTWDPTRANGTALLWSPAVPWGQVELSFTAPVGTDTARPATERVRGVGIPVRDTVGQLVATGADDTGGVRQEIRWQEGSVAYAVTFGADVPVEAALGLISSLEVPDDAALAALLFPTTAPLDITEIATVAGS